MKSRSESLALFVALITFGSLTGGVGAASYVIDASIDVSGTTYYGTGSFTVNEIALSPNNDITFSSGSISDFEFIFEELTVTIANNDNPTSEGVRTDSSGEVVAFVDTVASYADFRTGLLPVGRGVFFHESTFEFLANSASWGGTNQTGGTYSISKQETSPVPEPSSALLLGLGAFSFIARRRRA